ncbi:MAG: hypothetical protein N3A54_01560 [Patescibacteria group bacterium]|nr:hypothetical protein [Patescibacteria group bacterium]
MKTIEAYPFTNKFDSSEFESQLQKHKKNYSPTLKVVFDHAEGVYFFLGSAEELAAIEKTQKACKIKVLGSHKRVPKKLADDMGWPKNKKIEDIFDLLIQEASNNRPHKIFVLPE